MGQKNDRHINFNNSNKKRNQQKIIMGISIGIILFTSGLWLTAAIKNARNLPKKDIVQSKENTTQSEENSAKQGKKNSKQGNQIVQKDQIVQNDQEKQVKQEEKEKSDLQVNQNETDKQVSVNNGTKVIENKGNSGNEYKEKQDISQKVPVKVKGIYVTARAAGSQKLKELLKLADKKEINSFVIDIKDDYGRITYSMDSRMAKKIGATTNDIPDIKMLMKALKSKNIYTIARIVSFKDPYLAEYRHDLAIKNKNGTLFRDHNGDCWVNPYKREVWEYLAEVATKAAEVGFDEIQFDYIRFCTDKGTDKVNYGEAAKKISKEDIIVKFTKYVYGRLKPLGVYVSADVYGTVIKSSIDAKLVGQNYVEMSKYLDYICPMIYPSHFGEGNFGVDYPDLHPYIMIKNVLAESKKKLKVIPKGKHCATVRPWLQGFTASWVKHHMNYGGPELKNQINGVYDAGYGEWLIWNSAAKYAVSGLKDE